MTPSQTIAQAAGLTEEFPADVLAETARWLAAPAIDDPSLEDWTDRPFCTLDGPDTHDLDQALLIEADGDGWRVSYALADASFYVRPGTALWREALRRGASFYLPGLSIPMLPRPLSEGVISLGPDGPRRALVVVCRVAPDGAVRETSVHRARVRSVAQLAFPEVEAFLAAPDGHRLATLACADSVRLLPAVGKARAAAAARQHVVRTRRAEIEVKPGESPHPYLVRAGYDYACEAHNAQLSLLANGAGGAWLAERASEGIWRVHPAPGPADLDGLERLFAGLAHAQGLGEAWVWNRDLPLDPWVAALPEQPWRVRLAVERQAQIANRPSSYAPQPGRHHGVGADAYARFSAPMREMVGVQVHREAVQRMTGEASDSDEKLRDLVIASANRARQVQRQLDQAVNRVVLDDLFTHTRSLRATIVGLDPGKVHVRFDEPPVDAKVYVADLAADWGGAAVDGPVVRDGTGAARATLGGEVIVSVGGRDAARDRWVLGLTTPG